MNSIKIVSNPYTRELSYFINGKSLEQDSINSKLRENDREKIFLPFKAKEILDTIITEYYAGTDPIDLEF